MCAYVVCACVRACAHVLVFAHVYNLYLLYIEEVYVLLYSRFFTFLSSSFPQYTYSSHSLLSSVSVTAKQEWIPTKLHISHFSQDFLLSFLPVTRVVL